MGLPTTELRTWSRTVANTLYTCSTDPSLVQLDALRAAFASDLLWWATDLPPDAFKTLVGNSLCLAIYAGSSTESTGR